MIAVDIGNNRIKLGRFAAVAAATLPLPSATFQLDAAQPDLEDLGQWLAADAVAPTRWWIACVNRPALTCLVSWIRARRPQDRITLLAAGDLPLVVQVERPDMVGIDRLLDAVGANQLRDPQRPAVVVDIGSATTVDWVSRDGVFLGGAILPGLAMSARALHEFTDLLPLVDLSQLEVPPPALGRATVPAMRAGLFWGAVGAIRQLVERLGEELGAAPQVFISGGASPAVAAALGPAVEHVPHLLLGSIALVAQRLEAGEPG